MTSASVDQSRRTFHCVHRAAGGRPAGDEQQPRRHRRVGDLRFEHHLRRAMRALGRRPLTKPRRPAWRCKTVGHVQEADERWTTAGGAIRSSTPASRRLACGSGPRSRVCTRAATGAAASAASRRRRPTTPRAARSAAYGAGLAPQRNGGASNAACTSPAMLRTPSPTRRRRAHQVAARAVGSGAPGHADGDGQPPYHRLHPRSLSHMVAVEWPCAFTAPIALACPFGSYLSWSCQVRQQPRSQQELPYVVAPTRHSSATVRVPWHRFCRCATCHVRAPSGSCGGTAAKRVRAVSARRSDSAPFAARCTTSTTRTTRRAARTSDTHFVSTTDPKDGVWMKHDDVGTGLAPGRACAG